MHYVIYPDLLFIENFICNVLFLTFFKSLFFPAATWKRILLAGTMTALCNTCASILFFNCIWILQLGILFPAAGLMVLACFQIRERRRMLYLFYQMMLWTLVPGGLMQVLQQWTKIKEKMLCTATAGLIIVFGMLEKIMKVYRKQNECMREIALYYQGKCIHVRGFADTGNQLRDPVTKLPVSIVSKDVWERLTEDTKVPLYRLIPYKTVGNPDGILWSAQIDYMVILEGAKSQIFERPMLAVTEQSFEGVFHYSILLHSDFC